VEENILHQPMRKIVAIGGLAIALAAFPMNDPKVVHAANPSLPPSRITLNSLPPWFNPAPPSPTPTPRRTSGAPLTAPTPQASAASSGGTFIFPPWWPIVFPTPKPPTHTPTPPPHATATRIPTQPPATATATQVPTQPPATATQVPTQPPATATQVPTQPPATATQPAQPTATTAPASGVPSSGATRNGCAITTAQAQAEQYLFGLLNQHRAAAGARALQLNETISTASREHSCDMFQHQQLNHYGSDGSSPFQRISATGTSYSTAGENIGMAGGYGLNGGIDIIDNSMMAEPSSRGTHHWNIINAAYTQVGIGVIYTNGQVWFTEDFVG